MLQVRQYLTGTSMAAVDDSHDLMSVQSVVDGPRRSGSSLSPTGGKAWRFRGRICVC